MYSGNYGGNCRIYYHKAQRCSPCTTPFPGMGIYNGSHFCHFFHTVIQVGNSRFVNPQSMCHPLSPARRRTIRLQLTQAPRH